MNKCAPRQFSISSQIYCAGTLIAPRWILTSASCVLGSRFREAADSVHIRLGVTDRTNLTTAQDVPVEEIKVHELYNASNYANDLALIRLTSTISYNAFVSPICLPPPFGKYCYELSNFAGGFFALACCFWARVSASCIFTE